jgi:ABC-type amino acid transport substrate-binding protein
MKKKTRVIGALLALLLLTSAFAACGQGDGSAPPTSAPGGAPELTPDASMEVGAEPGIPQVLRVGMECGYAPYNWTQLEASDNAVPMPDGTYVDGYDIKIAQRIAEELGVGFEIVKVDWDGLPPSLTSGKIDLVIAGMTDTAERRETIDFTDPYWSSPLMIVVRRDGQYAGATSLADFSGAKITGQLGTVHYDLVDRIPGVDKQPAMETFPAMLVALTSGKIDGYIAERPSAVSAEISSPEVTYIEFAPELGFGEEITVSIGLRHGEDTLREKLNGVLAGISTEERLEIMDDATLRQPLAGE